MSLLKLFTFLPLKEIKLLAELKKADIRQAKEVLAFETTKISHGEKEAEKAQIASRAAFAKGGGDFSKFPTTFISKSEISAGISILDLLMKIKAASSKSEAIRLINQGGIYIDKKRISEQGLIIKRDSFRRGSFMLRKGKKQYYRVETR